MNEGYRIARDRCVTGLMTFKSTNEVIEMNMPGFTAEASLYNVNERYQATAQATVYGGLVQPAQSDVYIPRDPPRVTPDRSVYPPRSLFCLTTIWYPGANGGWTPHRVLGFWNPITGRCE